MEGSRYFDKDSSALLLIDYQVGTMKLIKNLPLESVKKNAIALAKIAQALDIPVVLTSSQEDQFQGPIMDELAKLLPKEHENRIKRTGLVNAWDNKDFVQAVKDTGRTNLIMAGVTTDICLIYPSISAMGAGYGVQAVMDASGSPFNLSEELSRKRMHDAGVVMTATNTLLAELVVDWSSPAGVKLKDLLFSDILSKDFIAGDSTPY